MTALSCYNFLLFAMFTYLGQHLCGASRRCSGRGNQTNCSLNIDSGNLNFTAAWDCSCPTQNLTANGHFILKRKTLHSTVLCETDSSGCYIGGALLDGVHTQFPGILIELETSCGYCTLWFVKGDFNVGPPDILPPDIGAQTATLKIRGAQTPLYSSSENGKTYYRGPSWPEDKSPIYMGQQDFMNRVDCYAKLINANGSTVHEESSRSQYGMDDKGEMDAEFAHLKPYSDYHVAAWCSMVNKSNNSGSVWYNFTTLEDVPSSGASIQKPASVALGCVEREMRNITMTIQPPPAAHRNGILLFYEICYRSVSSSPEEEWRSEIYNLPHPTPASSEVALPFLSRWDAYEIKVYANNSVGGIPSSVHQFEVLKPTEAESRPQNVTYKQMQPGVWLLQWDAPWSDHTGDCIMHYTISEGNRSLGSVNSTVYLLDTAVTGPVRAVRITPVIYNGTGPEIKGIVATVDLYTAPKLSQAMVILLAVFLAVFTIAAIVCAYMCVKHGPRWTDSFDIRNNSVLKAALAMGDLLPRTAEREQFDTLVGVPPPAPDTNDAPEVETTALIQTQPAEEGGDDAVPRPPSNNQTPPRSEDGSISEQCGNEIGECIPMSMDVDSVSTASRSSSDEDVSGGISPNSQAEVAQMSCSEDSLSSSPPHLSPPAADSDYVQSPPQVAQLDFKPTQPVDNSYVRMNSLTNKLYKINQRHSEQDVRPKSLYKDGGRVTNLKESSGGYVRRGDHVRSHCEGHDTGPRLDKFAWQKASRRQSSLDSEGSTSGSLSPSDSEAGDGMESYTKLSRPNTPLSPRNKLSEAKQQVVLDIDGSLNVIHDLLNQLSDTQPLSGSDLGGHQFA